MLRKVYFDNASTTNIHPEVLKTYIQLLQTKYANSESLYDDGTEVNRMMENARQSISKLLQVKPNEVIFTSGASESNNLAIKGIALKNQNKKHLITSQIEHSSVLNACKELEQYFGYEVTYLPVDSNGVVNVKDVKNALREDTCLVSIMAVNNEVGSINPIQEIKELVKKESHAYFHVDAVQAAGKLPLDLKDIDLLSISAHKIEGLKGSGILVKKSHVDLLPLINGGQQEMGIRGGTANALVNIMFAKTLRISLENLEKNHSIVRSLQAYCLERLKEIEGIEINSPVQNCENIINFSYEKIPSEVMMNALNQAGIMVSAQSTCESKSNNPSHVLAAMGYSNQRSNSCIRISFSQYNTKEEIEYFIQSLKEIITHYG